MPKTSFNYAYSPNWFWNPQGPSFSQQGKLNFRNIFVETHLGVPFVGGSGFNNMHLGFGGQQSGFFGGQQSGFHQGGFRQNGQHGNRQHGNHQSGNHITGILDNRFGKK